MSGVTSSEGARALLLEAAGGTAAVVSWFEWRTFSPDRRAELAVSEWGNSLWLAVEELRRMGATAEQVGEWQARFVKKWLAYQLAGSRTMNWMITGPARFPVERNNKRMETERKRGEELDWYLSNRLHWLRRRQRSAERAAKSEDVAASGEVFKEMSIPGCRLIHNTALDRVQLVFDGKPDRETISDLKARAFRWSPREGAWQRQLTNNGIWAAQAVLALCEKRRLSSAVT